MKGAGLIFLLPFLALIGCKADALLQEANDVQFVTELPDNNPSCMPLGEITGTQKAWLGWFSENSELLKGAQNDLKNKAHKVGANVVYLQDEQNINWQHQTGSVSVTILGGAYFCNTAGSRTERR